jgi:hypothetical protein
MSKYGVSSVKRNPLTEPTNRPQNVYEYALKHNLPHPHVVAGVTDDLLQLTGMRDTW